MARKPSALLKSVPIKLSKSATKYIDHERKRKPVVGCEAQYTRYIEALEKAADADARLDAVYKIVEKEGGTSSSEHWGAFQVALRESAKAGVIVFGALDAYVYKSKHINDVELVNEDELRAIVIDSLSDKLEGVLFTVNHGILGSKVAQSLRHVAVEAEVVEPPLCADCAL